VFQMFGHELVQSRNQERLERSLARYRLAPKHDLDDELADVVVEMRSGVRRDDAEVIELIFGTSCDTVDGIGA
jgi:hypothetical protein